MKKILLPFAMLTALFNIFPTSLFGADSTNSEVSLKGYEKLTSVIEKNFKQTADTLMAIQDPDHQAPDWKTIRALKTKLWLQLLDQLDKARDLNFDFNDLNNAYSANVAPPDLRYDSGVDPAVIKEPEIRLAYKEAIRENHAKAVRFNFELQLKKQDEQITTGAVQYFNSVYEKTPKDAKELVGYLNILTDSKHNAEVKKKLHEFSELATEQNK